MEKGDISININEYLLNYRVSAIIKKNGRILTHYSLMTNHYTLPGGRVKEGESSIKALQREIIEEMGLETDYIRPVSFIENFFELRGKKYHELLVTHELQFKDLTVYNKEIKPIEEEKKGKLEFRWIEESDLEKINFVPKEMKKIIKENNKFQHIINNDMKL